MAGPIEAALEGCAVEGCNAVGHQIPLMRVVTNRDSALIGDGCWFRIARGDPAE